ncbi:MAG: exodeoxyribonuclease III [Pseudomonadota bacterium]
MKIATWNVNSLRVRLPHLLDWLSRAQPDVVGLQELKCTDEQFPRAELEAAGWQIAANGQKTYNGVAILSRHLIEHVQRDMPGFADEQKRVIAATIKGVRIVNVYVVNGQAVGSEKYAYKLRWLAALKDFLATELAAHPLLALMGDFNIAPTPEDTHDPAQWEGQILCSEAERAGLRALLALGLQDAHATAKDRQGHFTWWDYRQAAFQRDLGLRIDHILLSQALSTAAQRWAVDTAPRKLERPSDHAPVTTEMNL